MSSHPMANSEILLVLFAKLQSLISNLSILHRDRSSLAPTVVIVYKYAVRVNAYFPRGEDHTDLGSAKA